MFYKQYLYFIALSLSLLVANIFANDVNSGGQKGIVRVISAETLGKTGFHAGGSVRYATSDEYVSGPNGSASVLTTAGVAVENDLPHLISGDIFLAYGLLRYWDISINMPLYYDITGWEDVRRAGVGDLEIATKLAYPFQTDNAFFNHAYYLRVTFPTGDATRGYFPRHSYHIKEGDNSPGEDLFTTGAVFFNPMLVWSLNFNRLKKPLPLQLHANFGGIVAKQKSSSTLLANVGIEYAVADILTIFVELSGESRIKHYTDYFRLKAIDTDPIWLTPGLRFNFPNKMYMILAGDFGVSSKSDADRTTWERSDYQYSTQPTPAYGAHFTFGWDGKFKQPDRDKDGILDNKDKCPNDAEDIDGFEDEDGCSDRDNDKDGIADEKDKCPNKAATCDGCPVLDQDNDGIDDDQDKCPKQVEDRDNYEDHDGCPDLDNDSDGIPDSKDNCPDRVEDSDGYEDSDGCPDLDNDGDSIEDEQDKCPNVKGTIENSGCPKTKEIQRGRLVLSGVTFKSGKAELTKNSYTILDQVYESLEEWTEVKIEIQGHTDSQGSAAYNQNLSQKRADAVMAYLIQRGIAPDRLTAVGHGEEKPIAENTTAAGREANRRVELNRID